MKLATGRRQPVLIGGPTASGKSALALAIAERDGGMVINADAIQVYARWNVLSARPDEDELARAPHALYGHVTANRYSVGDWLHDMAAALARADAANLRPVVVGGTGLYLTALTQGLSPIPPTLPEVRVHADAMVSVGKLDALSKDLAQRDPATWSAIDQRNPARVQRAWEVLESTGHGLAYWHSEKSAPLITPVEAVKLVVSPPTQELNRRIDNRFAAMIENGALEECRAALAAGWNPQQPANRAIGAVDLIEFLKGSRCLSSAVESASQSTRRFAKRQRTWFRTKMANWAWHSPLPENTGMLAEFVPRG